MAIFKQFAVRDQAATVDYLVGRDRASAEPDYREPSVILGDPDRFEWFRAGVRRAQPVTACVVSFEEAVDDDQLTEHAQSLLDTLCAGIPRHQVEALFVAHRERSLKRGQKPGWRSGLHGLIANEHLATGKALQPFFFGGTNLS